MDPLKIGPQIEKPEKITDPTDLTSPAPSNSGFERNSAFQGPLSPSMLDLSKDVAAEVVGEENGREKLKRHRVEVAGRVWIPDIWGQEELLKDWIDCSAFDASLVPSGIVSARAALAREGRRANSGGFRIENRC